VTSTTRPPTSKRSLNDRVIVDRSDKRPSPPGTFLIWDGIGATIAQLSPAPPTGSTGRPSVKVTTAYGDYSVELGNLTVFGRLRGVWKKA